MTEYEMIVTTIRDTIRKVRSDADECEYWECKKTADRLYNHAAGLREALLIIEKIHAQFG